MLDSTVACKDEQDNLRKNVGRAGFLMLMLPIPGLLLEWTVFLPEKPVSRWTSRVDDKDSVFSMISVDHQCSSLLKRLFQIFSGRQALVRHSGKGFPETFPATILLDSRQTPLGCSSRGELTNSCGLNYVVLT